MKWTAILISIMTTARGQSSKKNCWDYKSKSNTKKSTFLSSNHIFSVFHNEVLNDQIWIFILKPINYHCFIYTNIILPFGPESWQLIKFKCFLQKIYPKFNWSIRVKKINNSFSKMKQFERVDSQNWVCEFRPKSYCFSVKLVASLSSWSVKTHWSPTITQRQKSAVLHLLRGKKVLIHASS